MKFEDITEVKKIILGPSYTFTSVCADKVFRESYVNNEESELHVYQANIEDVDSVEAFFSIYLKILYMKLFDGEPKEDLVGAFDNVVSRYELELKPYDKADLHDVVSVYVEKYESEIIGSYIKKAVSVYCGSVDQGIFLLIAEQDLFLIECENE